MGATFGKNLDTGMSHIKFDSTGRTVEFTEEESNDFDVFLRRMRAEFKMLDPGFREKDNIFKLYTGLAKTITETVKKIVDELVKDISALEITSYYDQRIHSAAERIKVLYNRGAGLSDTASREAVAEYLEAELKKIVPDDAEQISKDFYCLL